MFPNVVYRADVRMVQDGRGSRFAQKPFDSRSIPADLKRQKLQSNVAAKTCVFRFVHHAHSTAAKLLDHTIMRHRLANHVPAILADTGIRLAATQLENEGEIGSDAFPLRVGLRLSQYFG